MRIMRILYTTTIGGTMRFFKELVRELIGAGHIVEIATNENKGETPVPPYFKEWGCRIIQVPWSRSPLNHNNVRAITKLKAHINQKSYDIIHCHTPVASLCTRMACKGERKKGTRVFYTAHGFHFYKGAPLKNWVLFYPIEKVASHWTDVLITINTEDYALAEDKMKARKIVYIPGVGFEKDKIGNKDGRAKIRKEFNIAQNAFVLLSVGELNDNKNQSKVIDAVDCLDITYLIVGSGANQHILRQKIEDKGLEDCVKLAGQRQGIADFYAAADAYILPSYREGLNVSLMEAMANGLPCLAGDIRGNRDLIDPKGGFMFDPSSAESIRQAICEVLVSDCGKLGEHNTEKIKAFEIQNINKQMKDLYEI